MPAAETRRYAAARDGVLHEVVDADFRPRRPVYLARCGQRIDVGGAEVSRSRDAPGVLCRACALTLEESDDTKESAP